MSVILNVEFVGLSIAAATGSALGSESLAVLLVNTQFSNHVKIKFISKLINGISSVLEKLLKWAQQFQLLFSVLTSYNFPVILVL